MRLAPCFALVLLSSSLTAASSPAVHAAFAAVPQPQGGGGPVPEPSTLLLVGTGLVGVALTSRARRRGINRRRGGDTVQTP